MSDRFYLTREGYEKLKKELDNLKKVSRKQVAEEIRYARELGDLSENAEYDAAKEKQTRIEKRILFLQDKLSHAEIIKSEDLSNKEIRIGSKVKLQDIDNNKEIEYILVDISEADFSKGKISISSPVSQALLGHKRDEKVIISLPTKKLRYKIMSVDTEF